jgi:hypothetical protein
VVRLRKALGNGIWVVLICTFSAPASAQQASGIAGAVSDPSGAALPGVTVEAASAALIEKVRTAITDNSGRYNIVDLRPGTYSLTFALPGFSTIRREGIALTVGFTATINAQMQIGALEETVTVSGASPLVDIQNTQQQQVLPSDLLQALPTGVKGIAMLSKLVPGMRGGGADVGGAGGLYVSNYFAGDSFHGKSGMKLTYDGMQVNNFAGTGGSTSYAVNFATVEETAVETGGVSAESDANNVRVNLVPKEGSNSYRFDTTWLYTNKNLQSDNLSDDLRSRGVTNLNKLEYLGDLNVTLGGPILRDRLWFFSASRLAANQNQIQGIYLNKTRGTPIYTPDLERPAFREASITSTAGRITWQAAAKHKISGFTDIQSFQVWGVGDLKAMEAQTRWSFYPSVLLQGSWSSPQTNRLLLEAGWSATLQPIGGSRDVNTDNLDFVVSPDDVSITELSTGFTYNAKSTYYGPNGTHHDRYVERFALSYVTGSHAFKTGFQLQHGTQSSDTVVNKDVNYNFLRGAPNQVVQFASPYETVNKIRADLGIFVQDRWTVNRLALTAGLRLDYFNAYVPAQHLPATPSGWIPERAFAEVTGVPEWTDLNPRLGASYDLFGSGRTAVKASLGRYVGQMNANVAAANNPIATSVNQVTRQWTDINGNYIPDCDLGNFAENGECLQISNLNFGRNNPLATRYDEDLVRGFGRRDYLWDFIAEVQHQLGSRTSITVGYNHNWTDNPSALFNPAAIIPNWETGVTDNLAVAPADFDHYCIAAPVDSRLPGGGGYQICGLYDVSPAKFGLIDNVVKRQEEFGERTRRSDFVNASIMTRIGSELMLSGSVDAGQTVEDNCFVVDSPQQLLNCHVVTPFKAQTLVKANASYQFPGDFTVSGVFQNMPGISYGASYRATNAEIARSLGRNLAACGTRSVCTATAVVPLIPYQTLFDPRRTQFDLRFSKLFSLGARTRLQADLAVFNVFNGSDVLYANHNYGPSWRVPQGSSVGQAFVDGRLIQFGGRFTW